MISFWLDYAIHKTMLLLSCAVDQSSSCDVSKKIRYLQYIVYFLHYTMFYKFMFQWQEIHIRDKKQFFALLCFCNCQVSLPNTGLWILTETFLRLWFIACITIMFIFKVSRLPHLPSDFERKCLDLLLYSTKFNCNSSSIGSSDSS